MPTYSFQHKKTGETTRIFCTYTEALGIDKAGEWKMLLSAPSIVTGTGSSMSSKIDGGFNDVLNGMKKFYKNSTIDTK